MFIYYLIIVSLFVLFIITESVLLRRALTKIPLRIMVNGTRGKSTTVRILFELLRTAGQTVYAKTTGDWPQLFQPDGSLKTLKRMAPASIIENRHILWRWATRRPDALILECMALQPETQHILGRAIFRPTVTVITNILPDHKEVMGATLQDIGRSIAECLRRDTELFITQTYAGMLPEHSNNGRRHPLQITRCPFPLPNIPQSILDESWTLIRAVAARLQINASAASSVFQNVWQEIDTAFDQKNRRHRLCFYNLFSVNDIESAGRFIDHLLKQQEPGAKTVFYLNCRADRPLRTRDFTGFLARNYTNAEFWLCGDGWAQAYRELRKALPTSAILKQPAKKALQEVPALLDKNICLFGIANHKGSEPFIDGMERLLNGK